VGCPNAYAGCTEMPTADFLFQHVNLRCSYRKVPCRNVCGAMVALCKRGKRGCRVLRSVCVECSL
jgi:hypothetical protein